MTREERRQGLFAWKLYSYDQLAELHRLIVGVPPDAPADAGLTADKMIQQILDKEYPLGADLQLRS